MRTWACHPRGLGRRPRCLRAGGGPLRCCSRLRGRTRGRLRPRDQSLRGRDRRLRAGHRLRRPWRWGLRGPDGGLGDWSRSHGQLRGRGAHRRLPCLRCLDGRDSRSRYRWRGARHWEARSLGLRRRPVLGGPLGRWLGRRHGDGCRRAGSRRARVGGAHGGRRLGTRNRSGPARQRGRHRGRHRRSGRDPDGTRLLLDRRPEAAGRLPERLSSPYDGNLRAQSGRG